MLNILLSRLRQGYRTNNYPLEAPDLPLRYRGLPKFVSDSCTKGCARCVSTCPTKAISKRKGVAFDLGKCLFCTTCIETCPSNAISFSRDYRLAVRERASLKLKPDRAFETARPLEGLLYKLFSKSFSIRVVSAGGCNGCEVDVNVLQTIGWDINRFGIDFVASPRHADAILVCGPVTRNMKLALQKTIDAAPDPKILIALGACAISGGIYAGMPEQCGGCDGTKLAADLYIPGCPPHPLTVLDGLLRLLGKVE
ncbi:MAG: 4Fe-4S dicluster domain-containing protein [Holophagaceae bacterium]|jgi:Ni,Fe-hydrogenase III small subunit/NAD-dependent dihydropyrimidine dehydrogenase PreA subunit|nr:4Fe-4S dicluster domain-containing protein [Holophagaceae bacterium]